LPEVVLLELLSQLFFPLLFDPYIHSVINFVSSERLRFKRNITFVPLCRHL
jgi:hypothetical protein